jgi:L-ascorbate metabolism protein UlaG (beta-lactamase superfamily)
MRKVLRGAGAALLFLVIALCLAPSVIPPFLDRIYHRGPRGGHFDGERFFNPGSAAEVAHGGPGRFIGRMLGDDARAAWPERVPVAPTVPPLKVLGDELLVTWIGHATVLVQTQGLNILTDPIWSERASPFSFVGPKRVRAPGVRFEDLPKIDFVVISHNHYDHMDLPSLKRLWERDRPIILTSLGNREPLRRAGVDAIELDWGQRYRWWGGMPPFGEADSAPAGPARIVCPAQGRCPRIEFTIERNHHWSSRWGTDRNRALWSAFTITLPGGNIFFAGDTGWGDGSWVSEAARRGPFRMAIVPIGAYEPRDVTKTNHIDPAEALAIFERLKPAAALGVHWGTFQLTFEAIDDPPKRLAALRKARGIAPERFRATEVGQSWRIPGL